MATTTEYTGPDPLGYVLSLNLTRRHLTESQRAMVAMNVATLRQGARTDLAQICAKSPCAKSQAEAARLLNVGRTSVQYAHKVREKGTPELQSAVEKGEIPVFVAAKPSTAPAKTQKAAVDGGKGGALLMPPFAKKVKIVEIIEKSRAKRASHFSPLPREVRERL